MTSFILKVVFAGILVSLFLQTRRSNSASASTRERTGWDRWLPMITGSKYTLFAAITIVLLAVVQTSMVIVPSGKFATLKRIYGASALAPGHVIAVNGELGPQAEIIMPGFHGRIFLNIINEVEFHNVTYVPPGSCAILTARDGAQLPNGANFADPWSTDKVELMANNADYFMKNGGQRGPQVTVLRTGSYTLNPYLWGEPKIVEVTRVAQGTVGVVKCSVHAAVDFGNFVRTKPDSSEAKLMQGRLPEGAATAALVSVGSIGVWEEPLLPGLYNINTDAYLVTHVPVTTAVFEYKGGYTKKTVDVVIDDTGKVSERTTEVVVQAVPQSADRAITTIPEGWSVPQELRVTAQVTPDMAPFVVASLAVDQRNSLQIIEDRVITPVMRSVVRAVIGGESVSIQTLKPVVKKAAAGEPAPLVEEIELDDKGQPKTVVVSEYRPVKVLDLLENRAQIEEAVERRARPECLKLGVTLESVQLAESVIPGELLIARKREQLAQQFAKALKQEQLAQTQRQETEKARAIAEQQATLAAAEMKQKAAEQLKLARLTEAEGEAGAISKVAEAQKSQSAVLGQEGTLRMRQFELLLKAFEGLSKDNPQILQAILNSPQKWVPTIQVNGSGNGGNIEGAAAIFGHLMGPQAAPAQKSGN